MSKVISQREARRLRKRVEQLEAEESARRARWAAEYPGGVLLDTIHVNVAEWWIVQTARNLGHAVVVMPDKEEYVRLYGLRLPNQ